MKTKKKSKGTAVRQTAIHKIVFSKDHFTKKSDVEDYLDENGYKYRRVEETRKSFIVRGIAESAFNEIDTIEKDDGVTVQLGHLSPEMVTKDTDSEDEYEEDETSKDDVEDDEDDEDEEEEKPKKKGKSGTLSPNRTITEGEGRKKLGWRKSVVMDGIKPPTPIKKSHDEEHNLDLVEGGEEFLELVQKMDTYEARRKGVKSLREVLISGAQATIPGFYDVSAAFAVVVSNIMKDTDATDAELDAALDEHGLYLRRLYKCITGPSVKKAEREEMVSKMFDIDEEADDSDDDSDDDETTAVHKNDDDSNDEDAKFVDEELSEEEIAEDADEEDTEDDADEDADDDDDGDESEKTAKAVARLVRPMVKNITGKVEKTMGLMAKNADSNFERLDLQIKEGQRRLLLLEDIEQTKKGSTDEPEMDEDDDDRVAKSDEKSKDTAAMKKLSRNLIGA